MAKAVGWAYLAMSISMEMVIPGLLGHFLLDERLGTGPLFVLLGFAGGVTLAIWHLIRATKKPSSASDDHPSSGRRQL